MADPIQDLGYCGGAEEKKPSNVRFTYYQEQEGCKGKATVSRQRHPMPVCSQIQVSKVYAASFGVKDHDKQHLC